MRYMKEGEGEGGREREGRRWKREKQRRTSHC